MKNEGNLDRMVRGVLAIVFFALGLLVFAGLLSIVAYILAIVMLVTSAVGFCPLYKIFGISTDKK